MSWKNWPSWLKGGVIGAGVGFISWVPGILCLIKDSGDCYGAYISTKINLPILYLMKHFGIFGVDLFYYNDYFVSFISLLFWFIVGSIVGLIIGKIKSKSKRK